MGALEVRIAQTHRIVAPLNQSLRIESNRTSVYGAEGAILEAQNIVWMANNNISVNSKSNVVMEAKNGILLDIENIPITPNYLPNQGGMKAQYKVCICMPQGKLFKVPVENAESVRINCAHVSTNPGHDPCLWAKLQYIKLENLKSEI